MKTPALLIAAIAFTGCAHRPDATHRSMETRTLAVNCFPAGSHAGEPRIERSLTTSDFVFPWSVKRAPRTEFTAHVHKGRLHFTFDCDDRDLVIARKWRGESTLDGEDRVEIFFARDAALARYFCIEIDPLGRVHDYAASHYRKFDSAWNCPGLRTTARRTASGYRVDASLPLASLSAMLGKPVRSGDTVRAGLFRAEFYGREKRTHGEADDNWLSWVRPAPATPDFHVASAFTNLRLPSTPYEIPKPHRPHRHSDRIHRLRAN